MLFSFQSLTTIEKSKKKQKKSFFFFSDKERKGIDIETEIERVVPVTNGHLLTTTTQKGLVRESV